MNLKEELQRIQSDRLMNVAEYEKVVKACRNAAAKDQSLFNYFGKISRPVVDRLQAEGLRLKHYPATLGWDRIDEHFEISWQ